VADNKLALYDNLQLATLGLSKEAFDYGIQGFENLLAAGKLHNDQIISIVDFSRASSKKRLFVIDLKNRKSFLILMFHTVGIQEES
jgi:poly-gamma-glutamate capsule biosynthesis protein CapA/YwtB (metallophosphatase superfamily)